MVGIIFIIIAYLVGSLSSAILVCKAMSLPDPRTEGSGNAGATNVLRIAGKLPAILTLVGDLLKGFLPVLIAYLLGAWGFMLALVALAAVVGHIFPLFFKFQGGKGVATLFGGMLVLSFPIALISLIVWIVVVAISRYISLASLVAVVLGTLLVLFFHTVYFLPILIAAILIIWRHMENIQRLKAGTENKFNW
ncbi:MAG TPA: glycerol-3-phosphate 1-O-acyltransferase PlsY [Gammaproteobacteria bacterium]|nr:glycerol-3-phosphate 1-O-acyltransferase PlsY [Gammaproteobacteria bacterium]